MNNKKNNLPIFIMCVGLPGSGKSTYSKILAKEYDAEIFSSDELRIELFNDVNRGIDDKEEKKDLFAELHKRIKNHLKSGKNAIMDATNVSSKRRKAFLTELKKIPCKKVCVIMGTPYIKCIEFNEKREKKVPKKVIDKFYKNWNIPYWYEGWDEIYIKTTEDESKTDEKILYHRNVKTWIEGSINIDQHNHHHTLTLGEHCRAVGNALKNNKTLYYAGLLHDVGKPSTKSNMNSKGEITEDYHYYQHHCTGAYESLFFEYPEDINKLDISILINLHMMPYFWEKDKEHGEKIRNKYFTLWGEELFNKIMQLHSADKNAH